MFEGIQVKTRDPSYGPFKFTDMEIRNSLERFVRTEKEFKGKFKKFVICTNCGFWKAQKNSSNLDLCLGLVRSHDGSKSCYSDVDFSSKIKEICNRTGCSEDFVLNVLKKVETTTFSDLNRYETELTYSVAQLTGNSDQRYDVLRGTANALIATTWRAAASHCDTPRRSYFAMLEDSNAETQAVIDHKRITAAMVQDVLNEHLNPVTLLHGPNKIEISDLPKGMRALELKMAKGGISEGDIELAKDLKFSAERLLVAWMKKRGATETEARYEHLSIIVRNECQEALDEVKAYGEPFGERMLNSIRRRLRERYLGIKQNYIDCLYEHLMGVAGILTEECKIWWSEPFEISQVS